MTSEAQPIRLCPRRLLPQIVTTLGGGLSLTRHGSSPCFPCKLPAVDAGRSFRRHLSSITKGVQGRASGHGRPATDNARW